MSDAMSDIIQLNCWVIGDTSKLVFPVDIPKTKNVGHLKEWIKYKLERRFKTTLAISPVLWKVSIHHADFGTQLQDKRRPCDVEGAVELDPSRPLSDIFKDHLADHIHIIVQRPAALHLDLRPLILLATFILWILSLAGLPFRLLQALQIGMLTGIPQRKFKINGAAIRETDIQGHYYLDPGTQSETIRCLDALLNRRFVLLWGARASGKTTRLFWLRKKLRARWYRPLYFSFEHINCQGDVHAFWRSFGRAVEASTTISSRDDFLVYFKARWWWRNVVLLMDEFSELSGASPVIRDECLRAFREIRNNNKKYAIRSFIAAGTFGILDLTPTDSTIVAPFNVADHIPNPYFSLEEIRKLFGLFARDNNITVDDDVVEDIWAKSNGHPGMVSLCGRMVEENVELMTDFGTKRLSYQSWLKYSADLHKRAYRYITFRTMMKSLLREEATHSVNLLRSHFVGFLGTVSLEDHRLSELADFLTSQGVLLRPDPLSTKYRIASPLIDGLVRRYVIPEKFPATLTDAPPLLEDGRLLDVLGVLMKSVTFFDRNLIRLAAVRSYKQSKTRVRGTLHRHVPRESVYDTELMRVLTNWLSKLDTYTITGQWHLRTGQSQDKYCDIVLKKPMARTILLELLATGDATDVRDHISRAPYYRDLLCADEAWVVHFTCEDHYHQKAIWQSEEQLKDGINVVHFMHDLDFTTLSMAARWKGTDGNVKAVHQVLFSQPAE